jgi:GNAT superfamily N-acetyltransferase
MSVVFFKRYRMQIDLARHALEPVDPQAIRPHYRFYPWQPRHLFAHAEAKLSSFRNELDANVFPCLADWDGCIRLMTEISNRQNFVPEATWLAGYWHPETGRREYCATVQGIRDQFNVGAIQNIGVAEPHRGKGLGSLIILHCLHGFQKVGVQFVNLEVTAQNTGAIRLYERLGFQILKTVFKIVELPE